jgi:hypothetical protein
VEVPLPWERLLWRGRSLVPGRGEYALTDFRLVRIDGDRSDELAIHDIAEVQRVQSPADRLVRTSTLIVRAQRGRRSPLVIRHVRRGQQLAALLELLAGDPHLIIDPVAAAAALAWEPRTSRPRYGEAIAGIAVFVIGIIAVVAGLHGKAASVAYTADDPIYPNGQKQDRAAVIAFMETQVMPWARQALAPIKGGPDRVSCETCHGKSPEVRSWRMPSVAALPKPDLVARGWEIYSAGMNAQMRNAIYGYLAGSDNQARAAYMREVVMPGMARLLHRPAYDFTKTYDYNRTRNAFGCYHCHMVRDQSERVGSGE